MNFPIWWTAGDQSGDLSMETTMQDHNEVIAILAELYPRTFFVDPRLRRPIKVNISAEIDRRNEPELNGYNVGAAVDWYTGHYGYGKSIIAGSPRLDLDGKQAGTVTEAEANSAEQRIAQINAEKQRRGEFPPPTRPRTPMTYATSSVKRPTDNIELLGLVGKKVLRVRTLIEAGDDDGLLGDVARPIVKSIIDDLNDLYARLG
jgi:hypothetical protein